MSNYAIVLMHGPVESTEYIGNDTVLYRLENGRKYTIRFSIEDHAGKKFFYRHITDDKGNKYEDRSDYDLFNEELTTENYAQWTADNFFEITEFISDSEGN